MNVMAGPSKWIGPSLESWVKSGATSFSFRVIGRSSGGWALQIGHAETVFKRRREETTSLPSQLI
jgi:hypothetical protein